MSDNETSSAGSIDDLTIEEIDRELVEIDEKLDTLPADDFGARVDLRTRHEALQARAAHLSAGADEQRSTEEIQIEVGSLKQRIAVIQGEMIDSAEQGGEGNVPGPDQTHRSPGAMNREIGDAQGAAALVRRLDKLEGILRERGADGGPSTPTDG
jgi:hypothetical protein